MALFKVFDLPETIIRRTAPRPPIRFPTAPRFDFATGDFVVDGAGRVEIADGQTAWEQWCVKAVLTQRAAYRAYDHTYGADLGQALGQAQPAAQHVALERTIRAALLVDRRTQEVREFAFSRSGDVLTIGFTVIPRTGEPARLEVTLNG